MSLVERVAEAIHPWICADPHEGISGNAHKAANAALMAQGFVTCQTCGGKGDGFKCSDFEHHGFISHAKVRTDKCCPVDMGDGVTMCLSLLRRAIPCPDCRLGVVPSEAMIDQAAAALWQHKFPDTPNQWFHMPVDVKEKYRPKAKAALLAAFGGDE